MEMREYYADPERYEAEYGPFSIDRKWNVRRAVAHGGPVLELGCGTGRILFAVAAEGLAVDGIDNAPAMLDRARTRAVLLGRDVSRRVGLHEAELASFDLGRRFRTVLAPLNCLMHLLSDRDFKACLERVAAHLQPDGRFLCDLTCPRPELIEATSEPGGVPLRNVVVRGVEYLQREQHRYDPVTRISRVRYTFGPTGCRGRSFATELRLRMYPAAEVERLAGAAGLRILEHYGDFKDNPPDPNEDVMQMFVMGREPRRPD